MKHQTINLVKFKVLGSLLGLPQYATVGVLESLWLFCQHNATDGDLTRFKPIHLAAWVGWDKGEPEELVEAFVEAGWLDRDGDRLVVHDWEQHCPNWIKGCRARSDGRKSQPSAAPSTQPSTVPSTQPSSAPSTVPAPLPPNLTKPNLTNSIDRLDRPLVSYAPIEVSPEVFEKARPLARRLNQRLGDGRPLKARDREIAIQASVLASERLGEDWLDEILEKPQLADRGGVTNRWAYFTKACKTGAERLGYDWHELLRCVFVPRELVEKPPPVPA